MIAGRNEFALAIGHAVLRANEIDWMTLAVQKEILCNEISKSWAKKPLKERVSGIIADLKASQESLPVLVQSFVDVESLCDARNDLVHGSFVLMPSVPTPEFATLKLNAKGPPMTLAVAKECASKWLALSNQIAEQLAIFEMRAARLPTG